jgi:hypothetical protein
MFVNNTYFTLALLIALGLLIPPGAQAVANAIHDPHRITSSDEFQDTIEARCTICHTRDRVDQALGEGEDLDTLLQRMIERGAIISDRDKKVLGTFWGSPTSGDQQPTPAEAAH